MIQADIDPSLRSGEPAPERLDDGFSPPAEHQPPGDAGVPGEDFEPTLGAKSPF